MHSLKSLVFVCLVAFMSWTTNAQIGIGKSVDEINYAKPLVYEIAGVTIDGSNKLDHNAIVLLSGLTVGEEITIPGQEITDAVKRLWKQKLFSDVKIYANRIEGNLIFLEIYLEELPRLSKFAIKGTKKSEADHLRDEMNLTRGNIVTENLLITTKEKVLDYFIGKGFYNAEVSIDQYPDTEASGAILEIKVVKNQRVKINEITFEGNTHFPDNKLRRTMKGTKRRSPFNIFRNSKFLEEEYELDKEAILALYNQAGYRDARIINDSVSRHNEKSVNVDLKIEEGNKYFFRNINWIGNSIYSSEKLTETLGIKPGDPFDQQLLSERLNLNFKGTDVTSLYMDEGYLFFGIEPVEVLVENDSIDYEMRIVEGKQATIRKITVEGNTKTNDHVIMRELYTKPGELFRRSDIIRSQEELNRLGYFNPQTMGVTPLPDPVTGTVDINYSVEEKSTDQIELQGGWGGNTIVGTFGVRFNNFSLRKAFKKGGWRPVPAGDGQQIAIRASTNGDFFQSYSISFTEPWLGGKKPTSLTLSANHSIQKTSSGGGIKITGISAGLGKRLKWPDDYFTLFQGVSIQRYDLDNYNLVRDFRNGFSNNITYKVTLGRSSVFNPIYPKTGSKFQLTGEFTPPYSLFNDTDYDNLEFTDENGDLLPEGPLQEKRLQEKYEFLEYYKIKFNAGWFNNLAGDLVLKTNGEFGFLSYYSDRIGLPPFERFHVGGDGLSGFALDGREIIGLRGYPNQSLNPDDNEGGSVYAKYTAELRYPLTLNPNSTIYGLIFAEAGNAWRNFEEFNPFEVKRSAGMGFRIFMPMFGILGVDFGYGYDPLPGAEGESGWQTHFIIGQQF